MHPFDPVRISRFLSLVLRHKPEEIGIDLDANGWTSVQALLEALKASGRSITFEQLETVVATDDKGRYAFNADKSMVRASQGHSISVDLNYTPMVPPPLLYHGTVDRFLKSIREAGLVKRQRHHVHLSPDVKTARVVGSRRGRPVILEIAAGKMHTDGHTFFLSENGVWLTDQVPVQFITFPQ